MLQSADVRRANMTSIYLAINLFISLLAQKENKCQFPSNMTSDHVEEMELH